MKEMDQDEKSYVIYKKKSSYNDKPSWYFFCFMNYYLFKKKKILFKRLLLLSVYIGFSYLCNLLKDPIGFEENIFSFPCQ